MQYQSTRNKNLKAGSAQAILDGLAPDGGLYTMPSFDEARFDYREVLNLDTFFMSARILAKLLPDFSEQEMASLVRAGYGGKFESDHLTPSVPVGEDFILELFRGPTSAFKDVALSMLPRLMTAAKEKCGVSDEILILTATSGDTGKAAMEGFCDVVGTKIIVFYPDGGVSAVQKAQMVTQGGENTCVAAVRGNFDDAQTAVKQVFAKVGGESLLAGKGVRLSSANSINIGRLAPQVVYYFRAYADLVHRGTVKVGDKVDYVVPTGNFGDILAGYFARELGLPVGSPNFAARKGSVSAKRHWLLLIYGGCECVFHTTRILCSSSQAAWRSMVWQRMPFGWAQTPMWTTSTPEDTSRSSFSVMPGSSCGVLPQLMQCRKAQKSTSFPASGRYKMRGMPHTSASTMSIRCKREKGNKREQIKSSARRYFFFPQQFLYFLPLPQGQGAFLAGVPAIVAAGAVFALNSAAISPR